MDWAKRFQGIVRAKNPARMQTEKFGEIKMVSIYSTTHRNQKTLMKKLIILLSGCLVALPTFAGLDVGSPDYDPFANATNAGGTSYTPGDNLAGQASAIYAAYAALTPEWYERTAGASSVQPTIASNDLTYPKLLTSHSLGSVQLSNTGDGNAALKNFTTSTGGETSGNVYFSYLLQISDLTGVDSTNGVRLSAFVQVQTV